MARNYSITFKSLRTGDIYTVTIGGGTGAPVPLKGGASPFVTSEDADEDMFVPLRTQSGYIRILDDGYAADGVTAFDWKDLLVRTNTERPVTLTMVPAGETAGTIVWQGFMQSQNFSGELYGNPQEREFPVQCPLSSLVGGSIPTDVYELKNFAWIIATLVTSVQTGSSPAGDTAGTVAFQSFAFQGGTDARAWLLNKVDWRNFLHEVEGSLVPKYDAQEVLTDICRFWGWTCRIEKQTVVFSRMGDLYEQDWITFTKAEMLSLGSGSGTASTTDVVVLSGDIFASTDNEEMMIRGVKRAVVKVDVNADETTFKFAPEDLENEMGEPSVWVQTPDEDQVGYYKTTPTKKSLDGNTMTASVVRENTDDGFERRTIFSSADTEDGETVDSILIRSDYVQSAGVGQPLICLTSKRAMAYGGGSLGFRGTIYKEAKPFNDSVAKASLHARVGIGMTRLSAKWFYLYANDGDINVHIYSGWSLDSSTEFLIGIRGSSVQGAKINVSPVSYGELTMGFGKIPVEEGLYGYLYIDILGGNFIGWPFEIADFEVTYSKEETVLPQTGGSSARPRTIKEKLVTERSYDANNSNTVEDKWNADCIFATDNNCEYGYGLILSPTGGFVKTVSYNGSSQQPEQHLANSVAAFGNKARRMLKMELRKGVGNVDAVAATKKVSLGGGAWYPIAIDHDWRDDVKVVTIMELG